MFKRLWKREEGQVLVMAVLLLATLLGFAALVIDVGYFYTEKRQLQTAVDAAALAGAIVAYEVKDIRDDGAVEDEVETYLKANVDEPRVSTAVTTDWNSDPLTVKVDLTTNHPTFFAKILGEQSADIYAMAKAKVVDRVLPASPYSIFAETGKVVFTGNHNSVYGGIYSKSDSGIDKLIQQGKVKVTDGVVEFGTGQVLPDYSQLLNLPATTIDADEFNKQYIDGLKEVSGLVIITTTKKEVSIKGTSGDGYLKGKGIIYSSVDMKINVPTREGSSFLYYSDGNITLSSSYIYGIVYAPKGTIEFNGDPNIPVRGKLLAKKNVNLNGGKFELLYNENGEEWMEGISKISKLIE